MLVEILSSMAVAVPASNQGQKLDSILLDLYMLEEQKMFSLVLETAPLDSTLALKFLL